MSVECPKVGDQVKFLTHTRKNRLVGNVTEICEFDPSLSEQLIWVQVTHVNEKPKSATAYPKPIIQSVGDLLR